MRTSLLVIVFSFLASTAIASGRNRQVVNKGSVEQISPLNRFTAEELARICRPEILSSVQPFFYGWIVKALQKHPFTRPAGITHDIGADIQDHLYQVTAYLNHMTELSKDIAKYSRFYFDVKINDLNSRTFAILEDDFVNVYDSKIELAKLADSLGPHAEELVDSIASQEVGRIEIESTGAVYKTEDLTTPDADPKLRELVNSNKVHIIKALYKIIDVFTGTDPKKIHSHLSPEQADFLQVYFNTFKYLLPEGPHHAYVVKALTGQDLTHAVRDHPFVNPALFNYLDGLNTPYTPFFARDNFITKFNPDYTLDELHKASAPALFSWDFFKAFDGVNYNDAREPTAELVKDESDTSKQTRKVARLHAMLYKVYTFARDDNTLPPQHPQDNQSILRKLKDWVVATKLFETPIIEEDAMVNPGKKNQALFPAPMFNKYFLPLLDLICKKIDGCDLLKTDKPAIVAQYVAKDGHDNVSKNKILKAIITPDLLNDIIESAAVKELETFADNIDDILKVGDLEDLNEMEEDLFPEDFEQNEPKDKDPKKVKKPLMFRKKLVPVTDIANLPEQLTRKDSKVDPKVDPIIPESPKDIIGKNDPKKSIVLTPKNVQDNFDETIGKKFLPDDTKPEDDPKKVAQLEKFLDTIDAQENIPKKRKLRHLLVNFIIKSKSKPLVDRMIEHKMKQIRAPIDFGTSKAFRNFLYRSMEGNDRYIPNSADDEYNYEVDVLFYIILAGKDNLKSLIDTKGPGHQETKDAKIKFTSELQVVNAKFINGVSKGGKSDDNAKLSANRKQVISSKLDEKFLERSSGIEFFSHFLDFFNYYEQISGQAQAANVDYYRIYLQFYQILAHLRRGEINAFTNPHEYVLFKMQECMIITEAQESFIAPLSDLNSHCQFSYRKYAEVLFFYKMYLFTTKKNVSKDLLEFQDNRKGGQDSFNVHTRMFIVFSSLNSQYSNILNINCNEETSTLNSMCTSWRVYNTVLRYMRNSATSESEFNASINRIAPKNTDDRINIFNGLEAAYYHNRAANMIDWSKVIRLFDVEGIDTTTGLGKALKFEPSDQAGLSRYLTRTFKKLTTEPHEEKIAKFVYQVLQNPDKSVLVDYLTFGDRVAPFHIKLFLQYAITNEHFDRLASVLIENEITSNLISINDVSKDSFFQNLIYEVNQLEQDAVASHVFEALQVEYSKTLKQCQAVATNKVLDFLDDPSILDLLGGIDIVEEPVEVAAKKNEAKGHELADKINKVVIRVDMKEGETIEDALSKANHKLRGELQDDEEYTIEEHYEEYEDEEDNEEEVPISAIPFGRQKSQKFTEEFSRQLSEKFDQKTRKPEQIDESLALDEADIEAPQSLVDLKRSKVRRTLSTLSRTGRNRFERTNKPKAQKPKNYTRGSSKDRKRANATQKIADNKYMKTKHHIV